jgi:hypothetical protein
MNITENVVADLLPLYAAKECSADTRRIVEEYLKAHPEYAGRADALLQDPLPGRAPGRPDNDDAMKTLSRTKRLLKQRTYFMAFAIFCSLTPFSFFFSNGTVRWLLSESPVSAAIYGAGALILWTGYFITRKQLTGAWS